MQGRSTPPASLRQLAQGHARWAPGNGGIIRLSLTYVLASMLSIVDSKWAIFTRVAEMGSVTRAALALDLPQSVVSRRIADLERECSGRLFRRTGRGVALTEFGTLVNSRIKAVTAQADEAADQILTQAGVPAGLVKLGLLPATVPALASVLVADVSAGMPSVRLHLMEGSTGQLEQWLTEGRLDFSLLLREESELKHGELVLVRQQLRLVARRDDALAQRAELKLQEIQALPLVLAAHPHAMRDLLDQLVRESGMSFQIAAEADSIRLHHEIIAAGHAYGLMFGPLAPPDQRRLVALPVVEPTLTRAVVLVHAAQRPDTLATREVARRLAELAVKSLHT